MAKKYKHGYVPLECQVHTCKNVPVAYCYEMYVFVCEEHRQHYCIPDGHRLESIEEGLEICIRECISNIKQSESYIRNQQKEQMRYQDLLAAMRSSAPTKTP